MHMPFIEVSGYRLGYGSYNNKDALSLAVAALGRQLNAASIQNQHELDYEQVARFYVEKILQTMDMDVDYASLIHPDHRTGFMSALDHLPLKKREAIYSNAVAHLKNAGFKANKSGCFVKMEDSWKGPLRLFKPRNIMVMSDLDYYYAWPTLPLMKQVYRCPIVQQWMIKGMVSHDEYIVMRSERGEVKHLSTLRKRNQLRFP